MEPAVSLVGGETSFTVWPSSSMSAWDATSSPPVREDGVRNLVMGGHLVRAAPSALSGESAHCEKVSLDFTIGPEFPRASADVSQ